MIDSHPHPSPKLKPHELPQPPLLLPQNASKMIIQRMLQQQSFPPRSHPQLLAVISLIIYCLQLFFMLYPMNGLGRRYKKLYCLQYALKYCKIK